MQSSTDNIAYNIFYPICFRIVVYSIFYSITCIYIGFPEIRIPLNHTCSIEINIQQAWGTPRTHRPISRTDGLLALGTAASPRSRMGFVYRRTCHGRYPLVNKHCYGKMDHLQMIAWHSYGLCWFTIGVKSSFGPVMTYPGPQSPLGIIGDQSPYPNECMGHGSLNVPIEHHPTIRYMVYNGYYKVMSNIPKVDSYHPLWDVHPFASLQSLIWAISRIHLWNFSIE